MAPLNPQAPAFFPNHHLQGTLPLPHQQHFVYYYPDTTLPFSSFPFHHHLYTHLSPSQPNKQQHQNKDLHAGLMHQQRQFFKFMRMDRRKKGEEQAVQRSKILPHPINYDHHHHQFLAFPNNQTTVMIKNIPSKYTRYKLVEFLERHCMKENRRDQNNGVENENGAKDVMAFDCVYLPFDFRTGFNKGYAFVNFTDSKAAWRFRMTASHKKWDLFQSQKIREIVIARLQGKDKLEKHFGAMMFQFQSPEVLPVVFSPPRDGVIKGDMRTIGKLV